MSRTTELVSKISTETKYVTNNTTLYYTRLTAYFPGQLGKGSTRKVKPVWIEARDDGVLGWQWYQLDLMQTICPSFQTDNHTKRSSLNFYRPDALPDA